MSRKSQRLSKLQRSDAKGASQILRQTQLIRTSQLYGGGGAYFQNDDFMIEPTPDLNESKEFDFLVEIDDNQSVVKNEYLQQSNAVRESLSQSIKNYPFSEDQGVSASVESNNLKNVSKMYM